ncbi:hypothetical protein KLP40_12290 [Hymenobacter sp. NST-14]|uniref:hypothetical protein n=1 Tax=Hymenobacter piscis TaxID=2839984 RepID=UPI001C025896|nr:hypothetical protein [Hymenobacter piscis]MBT9393944.1 hypothetical protein [Hymenobacter piscis]
MHLFNSIVLPTESNIHTEHHKMRSTTRSKKYWWIWAGLIALVGAVAFISYFNVDRTLTQEDRQYVQAFLPGVPADVAPTLSYEEQIELIKRAQAAVHAHTTGWNGIPEGQPREPKQLFLSRDGLCYDRSRVLEKIFTYLGFTNRHLAMFQRREGQPAVATLVSSNVPSHAISEVLTKKGWLLVDSNVLWVSLDKKGMPVSMPQLQKAHKLGKKHQWAAHPIGSDSVFYQNQCIPVYGLYSRHGRFYPPYVSGIPDYRIQALWDNFE